MGEHSHIADLLRDAREQRGLSVERAAIESGIPVRYLQLLEGESPSVGIPDEFYLIPFFRRYATFVGLEVQPLLPEFLGHVQQVPGDSPPPAPLSFQSPLSLLSLARLWKPASALLAIAVAAFLMTRAAPDDEVVAAVDGAGRPAAAPVAAPAPVEVDAAAPAAVSAPDVVVATAPALAEGPTFGQAADADDPTAPTRAVGARELRIVASEPVWLALGLDDEPEREFMLQPGDTKIWTANVGFRLKVGNAGGVTLAFDGRELPPLGDSGQVVRVRLPESAPPPSGG